MDNLGVAHMAAGDYEQAVTWYRRALTAARHQVGDVETEAWIEHHLGQAYAQLRDFPNATRAFRRTIALFRTLGNRRWEAIVLADLGIMLTEAGHPTIARAILHTALVTLSEFADPRIQEVRATLDATSD